MNILIIGGAYQGKKDFTSERFALSEKDFAYGETVDLDGEIAQKALNHLHLLIQRMLQAGRDVHTLIPRLEGHIVICDEIGCGIVPVDPQEDVWREATGRICCALARRADAVYWLHAGIAQCIKGAGA